MRFALHFVYYEIILSLVDIRLPTHPFTSRYIHPMRGSRNR